MSWPKTVFLEGRPGAHWTGRDYARSIGAEFHYIDEQARWHDITLPAYRRYLRWLRCGAAFPFDSYEVILVDGPHVWPPLAKYFRRKDTPVFALIQNETLYFIYARYLPILSRWGLLEALRKYDALIVIGQMQAELLSKLLGQRTPPTFIGFNGVSDQILAALPQYNPHSEVILLVAHGPSGFRTWYKGLDLWLEALTLVRRRRPKVEGWIVGSWADDEIARLRQTYPEAPVRFWGSQSELLPFFKEAGLYLHLGRGEAYGLAVLEVMAGGVPAIVSEWTGAKEVVAQVWPEGVVPLSAEKAAEAVLRFFELPTGEKKRLSEAGAALIRARYRQEQAVEAFQRAFLQACQVVGLR